MRFNVTEVIQDYDGSPLDRPDEDSDARKPLDYRFAIMRALNYVVKQEAISMEKKHIAYNITKKVYASKEPKLTVEEQALILERSKIVDGPLIFGRLTDFFNKQDEEDKEDETVQS